jgi:hypothetical protein
VSEKHDTATGKKLFIDMIINVNELSNVLVENISEDTSMYFGGDSINGNAEELRAFYKQEYSHLDKENREEIVQAALLISRLTRRMNFAFFARNDWRDQVQERERMRPSYLVAEFKSDNCFGNNLILLPNAFSMSDF